MKPKGEDETMCQIPWVVSPIQALVDYAINEQAIGLNDPYIEVQTSGQDLTLRWDEC